MSNHCAECWYEISENYGRCEKCHQNAKAVISERMSHASEIGEKSEDLAIRFTCEMNVFFTQIPETDVMVARLRQGSELIRQMIARSKLTKHQSQYVSAIDRVANRVAPMNEGTK
jgi:predicted ATP-dependent serine protease